MKEQLESIRAKALEEISAADSLAALEEIRVKYSGKKGEVTAILKQMGKLSAEERPVMGALANEVRSDIEQALESKTARLNRRMLEKQLKEEEIDITLPGKELEMGKRHPLQLVLDEFKEIFLGMGFEVVEGPEVEYDKYNFEMLNMPKSPATHRTHSTSLKMYC